MIQALLRYPGILKWDIRLQFRYYFWLVAAVLTAMWSGVLLALSEEVVNTWVPVLIFADIGNIGLLFIAGILFLERRQGTIYATAVMPISPGTWLTAKLISLSLLCLACAIAIVAISSNSVNWLRLIPSAALCAALFTSVGFLAAVSFNKILNYFLGVGIILIPFNLPVLDYLGIFQNNALWIIPSQPVMWALAGSFQEMPTTTYLGCIAATAAWLALSHWLGIRAFQKYIATRQQL